MRPISVAGLLAIAALAAIAVFNPPNLLSDNPELRVAALASLALAVAFTGLAILRLNSRPNTSNIALLIHSLWSLLAFLLVTGEITYSNPLTVATLLSPAGFHIARLLRRPALFPYAFAAQLAALSTISWKQ